MLFLPSLLHKLYSHHDDPVFDTTDNIITITINNNELIAIYMSTYDLLYHIQSIMHEYSIAVNYALYIRLDILGYKE